MKLPYADFQDERVSDAHFQRLYSLGRQIDEDPNVDSVMFLPTNASRAERKPIGEIP